MRRSSPVSFVAPVMVFRFLSTSLDIEFSLSGPKGTAQIDVPSWLRFWWNDWIGFDGGLRKTLRRMWLADGAYKDLDERLRKVWIAP